MGCGCKKSKFGLPRLNGGGKTPEGGEGKPKKRARIIANAMYPAFKEEYERTKEQYLKHYPGGVEFVPAYGQQQLSEAFNQVSPDEDLIMMAHFNKDRMYGVPVTSEEGQPSLSGLFQGLQEKGYKGNCYLGICHGEITGRDLQDAGVNVPIFAADASRQWAGGNSASQGSFEDFFFGLKPNTMYTPGQEGIPDSSVINPQLGQDYEMLLSERQQELMQRRGAGVPKFRDKNITFTPKLSVNNPLDKQIALAANQF